MDTQACVSIAADALSAVSLAGCHMPSMSPDQKARVRSVADTLHRIADGNADIGIVWPAILRCVLHLETIASELRKAIP
jgi:hypothetical protein